MSTRAVVDRVLEELQSATSKFNSFNNPHEGYAVILEELDELWDAIKANDLEAARREAIQVTAMGLRFLVDLYPESERP